MAGLGFVIELDFLNGREKLAGRDVLLVDQLLEWPPINADEHGSKTKFLLACICVHSRPKMKRRATLRSLAKINLDLRVLHKNPDGFHELRTVFQTISLADTIDIEFEAGAPDGSSRIDDPVGIPDNLILRAARAVLDAMKHRGAGPFPLDQAHSDGRRAWAADRATRPRCCWRCRCWPAGHCPWTSA